MNCKPGDSAITLYSDKFNGKNSGRLVEVLFLAPSGYFELPNGVINSPSKPNSWVCKSLGTPFAGALEDGMYGVFPDRKLRPLPKDVEEIKEDRVAVV
ncbi:hypothetical protein [Neptuniibacter sp.]|uniref:hypothetical protein n=1 Tax=Neptuniibacter sp. TaxID=1962643 RepID=UPI0026183615|nr:hypothetical protein [Neptuniibacter sp.]MCP4597814.1 DUF4159 domain-containing protein [Neptuniibacter sp.]